jgi:hypothetical protein
MSSVNQNCGGPFTPALAMADFSSHEEVDLVAEIVHDSLKGIAKFIQVWPSFRK